MTRRLKARVLTFAVTTTVLIAGPLAAGAVATDYSTWRAYYENQARTSSTSPTGTSSTASSTDSGTTPQPAGTTTSPTASSSGTTSASSSTSSTSNTGTSDATSENSTSSTGATSESKTATADSEPVVTSQTASPGYHQDTVAAPLENVGATVGAPTMWTRYAATGAGVGVALIDTGVVPVQGLTNGNVVNGPDLSFESQDTPRRYLDTYGHGTHMAGIIAGNDGSSGNFRGIAPGARLTSVKVAGSDGAVDVSQVVAAIDWVVAHRNDDRAAPIRVLNLSYGTDGVQDYRSDPLTHAVENAWRAGIVVVVAAGNNGQTTDRLNNPAYDPYVLTVGAADTKGTDTVADDELLGFSSIGNAARGVDVVAPGRSLHSLRVEGSVIHDNNPYATVGTRYIKGSGTSQAAAVVSGAVALLLQKRPGLKPDEVKAMLRQTATPLIEGDKTGWGAGQINIPAAMRAYVSSTQNHPKSTGLGSLEKARGNQHVADGGVELRGEQHILGAFDAAAWARASASGTAWNGGKWMGSDFLGTCYCDSTALGQAWSGRAWSGSSWSGRAWSGRAWSGRAWSGRAWSGEAWSGRAWSGRAWSGQVWCSADRSD